MSTFFNLVIKPKLEILETRCSRIGIDHKKLLRHWMDKCDDGGEFVEQMVKQMCPLSTESVTVLCNAKMADVQCRAEHVDINRSKVTPTERAICVQTMHIQVGLTIDEVVSAATLHELQLAPLESLIGVMRTTDACMSLGIDDKVSTYVIVPVDDGLADVYCYFNQNGDSQVEYAPRKRMSTFVVPTDDLVLLEKPS